MCKARTLADFISDGSEFADGTISVAEVSGAAPLASPTFTGTVNVTTLDASSYVYTDHLIVRPDAPNYIQLDGSYPEGAWNTALGEKAGDAWATGSNNNVAIGYAALTNSGTADYNTAVGALSLGSLYGSTAQHNTAIGSEAGKGITTGIANTAIGAASMSNFSSNLTGSYNVGVGRLSAYSNTSGSFNVAIGTEALRLNETGESNTAIGYNAGYNSTGSSNTFIGSNRQYSKGAGEEMTTGDKNIIIGPFDGNSNGLDIRTSDNNIIIANGDGVPRVHIDSSGNADITGSTTTTAVNLDALAATISDTAVDVFVYDTSKDSDGGAWRKRTQATSWYNETLNTATRGSRKEFPAVAVIVAESNQLTIYDGDDPDMPMWMVFNGTYDANLQDNYLLMWSGTGNNISCTTMSNGKLGVGVTTGGGLISIDFISEFVRYYRDLSSSFTGAIYSGTIADRNTTTHTYVGDYNEFAIVNTIVNDVAMTVLPNAPIDAATGLPVPTIAVGTNGGMSVIKDDGTVVDITESSNSTNNTANVEFLDNNKLVFRADGGTSYKWSGRLDIPSSTRTYSYLDEGTMLYVMYGGAASSSRLMLTPPYSGDSSTATTAYASYKNNVVAGTIKGFGQGTTDPTQNDVVNTNLVNYTSSSYNTGWMNGDIKLATLSDTDDTDVTGSELVTNGTFDSDTSGWTQAYVSVAPTTFSSVSGQLVARRGDQFRFCLQQLTVEVGKTYTVSVDSPTGDNLMVGKDSNSNQYGFIQTGSAGTGSVTFTATQTALYIMCHTYKNQTTDTIFDNISVRLAEEDRSVNSNGLQVFGTVTKSAVATGADLVAYSGFSASNYLEQPYNSDLDFGTGDFSFMVWLNTPDNSAAGTIIHRSSSTKAQSNFLSSGAVIQVEFNGTNLYGLVGTNGFSVNTGPDIPIANFPNNIWTHYALVRNGSTLSAYLNGKLFDTDTNTLTTTNTSATLFYGERPGSSRPFNGKMALTKWSATAPSPEQISKIYEDEKVLFQDGAQATLYGSSDAVTALAYDDSTELLHVGTSAGRSVFQGLRRVDNTTTAVGAAISASNGLVADE